MCVHRQLVMCICLSETNDDFQFSVNNEIGTSCEHVSSREKYAFK